jgi:hypothetical protein
MAVEAKCEELKRGFLNEAGLGKYEFLYYIVLSSLCIIP